MNTPLGRMYPIGGIFQNQEIFKYFSFLKCSRVVQERERARR